MTVKVTPILGVIELQLAPALAAPPSEPPGALPGAAVALAPDAKPAGNSTRWIFDVDGALAGDLVVQLMHFRYKKPIKTDLVAVSFLPRSPSFYDAKPYMAAQEGGLITVRHSGIIPMGTEHVKAIECSYRVMIDVLHTATR
jgi:hypothetical protein